MPSRKKIDSPFVVSATELTTFLRCNGAHVKALEAEGMPRALVTGSRGGARYDLCEVHTWMLERQQRQIIESAEEQRLQSLERERARLTRAQSEKTEMEVARQKRELVRIDLIQHPVRQLAKQLADAITALPMQMKVRDPSLTSTHLELVRDMLARFSNELTELPAKLEL